MTNKEKELIKDNLRAYNANFKYIKIVSADYGDGFYVFTSEERFKSGSWTQYCYNIDYLMVGYMERYKQFIKDVVRERNCDEYVHIRVIKRN